VRGEGAIDAGVQLLPPINFGLFENPVIKFSSKNAKFRAKNPFCGNLKGKLQFNDVISSAAGYRNSIRNLQLLHSLFLTHDDAGIGRFRCKFAKKEVQQ